MTMLLFFLFQDLDELRKQIEEEIRQQVKYNPSFGRDTSVVKMVMCPFLKFLHRL